MAVVKCFDCPCLIVTEDDQFCMVTPHGARHIYARFIPLCRSCRVNEGYDIYASYDIVTKDEDKEEEEPLLLTNEIKPEEVLLGEIQMEVN